VQADAVVAGAGPAGAATAILLAEEGLSVVLLDRAREVPLGGHVRGHAERAVAHLEGAGLRSSALAALARYIVTRES